MEADDRWARIRALFDQAAERPPEGRDAFLRSACADDPGLYREVRSLLDSDRYSRSLVGEAVRSAARGLDEPTRAGERIGPYRVVRLLGRGGMGAVYLAERADGAFDRHVALKLVKRGMDSDQILVRFQRERQILARLQHPNIARLFDAGVTDGGQPYIAIEHVEGEPIDEYCDHRRLTVEQRLGLFEQACRAVTYAHATLVVHRDLKPDNILVTAAGEVRLLDFGIAKVVAQDDEATALTQTGHQVMTPAYASPEQVRGEPVGTATDVYSLGVVLYELLAGVPPYELAGTSLIEVARVICTSEPDRPSGRLAGTGAKPAPSARSGAGGATPAGIARARGCEPERLRRQLAGDLDAICLKAIRKEPHERYGSVEALAADVRRHREGRPVLARTGTVGYRVRKGLRRHRLGFTTAAGVVGLIAAVVAFYTVRLADERDRARLEAAKAGEVATFLRGLFEVSDPSESRGETVTARELLDQGAARIEGGLADQPEVQVTMMRVIGETYGSLGLTAQALPLLSRALDRARAVYGADHEEVASGELSLGVALQNVGDAPAAEPHFRQALAVRRRLHGDEHPLVSPVLSRLAYLVEGLGRLEEAEPLYRDALALERRFAPPGSPGTAAILVRYGGLLRHMGRLDEAEPVLREALAAQRAAYGDVHPRVASAARNLAALLRDRGSYAEADTLYAEALAIRERLYGDTHPDVATTMESYGILLERMGEHDRALATFTEAVTLLEKIYDRPHPNLAIGYFDLGRSLGHHGRLDEAEARFRQAIRTEDVVLRADNPEKAYSRLALADLYATQGRHTEAEPLLRQAVAVRRAGLSPGDPRVGEALSELGASLTALRRYPAADSALVESYSILLEADGADSERVKAARSRLVTLYQAWGRPERAAEYR